MKSVKDKTISCFSSFHHISRPRQMALRIKEINSSFDSINKRATDLQLQRIFVDAPAAVPDSVFETSSITLDPIFIGRDDDVPKLVKVMTESHDDRKFTILAVVGMGGMGKTTLTRKVFNDPKVKARFGCHCWVHVSQTFEPLNIFKKFHTLLPSKTGSREAASMKLQKSFKAKTDEVETMEGILKNLQEDLKGITYLLVLDDVWNEDLPKWTDFINSLSGVTSTTGNGIVITTRSAQVASIVNPFETHLLNGLSDEDCWSIIQEKLFKMGNIIPAEFEIVGKKIARRCQGLPLAANVVGGVLNGKSEHEWLAIEENWLSVGEGDNISRILKLSYDNLFLPPLKKCFSYCSIFPKGHRMRKQELIELWMAERFLQPDGRNDMESVGDQFVNILLHNSLLQPVSRNDYEDEEIFVIHDLVHDLASSLLGSPNIRYMRHVEESFNIPKESAKCVRTLFVQGNFKEFKFSDFKSLHALSFNSYLITELPSSAIGKLIHLRRLDISMTDIEYLPDSIGELHHLQTLRADTYSMRKLPRTLKYLISLRHLYIHDGVKLPPNIGRLTSLQTLGHFTVGKESGCRIEELGSLTNLKRKLKISNLEMVQGKEEAEKSNISQNPNLLELKFVWDSQRGDEINDEHVLEGLQPHKNVKKLEINGFKGKRFPQWSLRMAVPDQGSWAGLNKLVEIRLLNCGECEEIPRLGHLPNLKHLHLRGFQNVKLINSLLCGTEEMPLMSLTVLRIMGFKELEFLPDELFHNNQNLSKLSISGCSKLRELPDGLHTLNSLEELTIQDCPNLKYIGNPSGSSRGTLRKLSISNCKELMDLPHEMVESSLVKVTLKSLSGLKNLPEVIECLEKSLHLTELRILGVPKFMAARRVENWPFQNVKRLDIDGSVEWTRGSSVAIKETVDGMLQGCGHSLTRLELTGLEIWECLPQAIQNLTAFTWLELNNFGIEELPEWFGNLSSLQWLILKRCKRLRSVDALGRITELEYLIINDCPGLRIDSKWHRHNAPHIQHLIVDDRFIIPA